MNTVYFLSLIFAVFSVSECISTYSIDLGSEFIKVAIVAPGVPMEVALNGESQRKTPAVVFIKDGERLFGEPGISMGTKYPKNLYHSITSLIGKTIDSPVVKDFIENFPYYEIFMNSNNQLAFKEGKLSFTVEELLAMLLSHSKSIAEAYSEMPMKGGVIVVPPYFTQDERLAVLRSAQIAGINVLQLINGNTAVGLNYGIFRRKSFNSTVQYYMFYDVGSSATVASIIGYQVVKDTDEGFMAESPQLTVVGTGYDRTLGASQFIIRLQKYLAKSFNAAKKTLTDVTTVPRSMAKLYKEASRVLKVLSANNEIYAQIENVLDDKDFKLKITRAEFEAMCKDLFERFMEPVHRALESAQIPMPIIKEIILMGGGTRIPKIQDMLLKVNDRKELGKGINTDEAAALGAVYQAAYISPGFKVQKFLIKDSIVYPISIDFLRYKNDSDNKETVYPTSRILFNVMNPFPQKKALTFNKLSKDFDFNVTTGVMDIDKEILFHVSVNNLTAVYNNYMEQSNKYTTEFKGVKTHFTIDHSGLLSLNYIEAIFEKKYNIGSTEYDESTLGKIGNTISNLFGSSSEEKDEKTSENTETSKDKKDTDNTTKVNGTVEKNSNESKKNESLVSKPKIIIINQNINFVSTWKSFSIPSDNVIEDSKEMLLKLKSIDDDKTALEKVKNELESYIFTVKNRFEEDLYLSCSTDSERKAAIDEAHRVSDWYEEQDMDTAKEEYSIKYKGLTKLMANIDLRVKEVQNRPDAIKKLTSMLNTSKVFLDNLRNVTGEGKVLTTAEYDYLSKLINETSKWLEDSNKTFTSKLYENPVILVADFDVHIHNLEREMAYLLNKISIWRNQTPPPPTSSENESKTTNKTETKVPQQESPEPKSMEDITQEGAQSKESVTTSSTEESINDTEKHTDL